MTRDEAQEIWNVAWDACLESERMRAQLQSDEGFACDPRDWCFEYWAFHHGLPPAPVILYPTASGMVEKHWDPEKQTYEEKKK